jgi:hypothetical protein
MCGTLCRVDGRWGKAQKASDSRSSSKSAAVISRYVAGNAKKPRTTIGRTSERVRRTPRTNEGFLRYIARLVKPHQTLTEPMYVSLGLAHEIIKRFNIAQSGLQ